MSDLQPIQVALDLEPDIEAVAFAEDPPGTWCDAELAGADLRTHLVQAWRLSRTVHPALRPMLRRGLALMKREVAGPGCDPHAGVVAGCVTVPMEPPWWSVLQEGCAGPGWPGSETAVHARPGSACCAVHVPGVGSLVARQWPGQRVLHFGLGRAIELRPSYQDAPRVLRLPQRLWQGLCVAQRLAQQTDPPVTVCALAHRGRSYVITLTGRRGDCPYAEAWWVMPLAHWRGPTYTAREHRQAWQEGRLERGDQRGLRVRVKGQDAVLAGYAEIWGTPEGDGARQSARAGDDANGCGDEAAAGDDNYEPA